MRHLIPTGIVRRDRRPPVLTGLAVLSAFLLIPQPGVPQSTGTPPSQQPGSKPGITTEGQKGAQRSRGADGTREFLGLGAPPDSAAAERGSKIYAASCSFCHGAKATGGDTGPDLVRSSLVLHDDKGELIGPVIHNGRADRGMPQFASFTNTELYELAEFLHQRVELAANRGTYQILNVLTGDPKAGEAWFQGAGGKIMKLLPALIRGDKNASPGGGFFLDATGLPDTGAAHLAERSAAAWFGRIPGFVRATFTVKKLDDFHVALFDKAGNFHSIPLTDGVTVKLDDPLAAHRELLDKYTDADMHNITAYLATLK